MKYLSKSEKLALAISKRFANPKQELAIQTTAGVLRDAVKSKGGHNSKKVPFDKKADGKREKKVPYGKARWGTLGAQPLNHPEAVRGTSPKVSKQLRKSESYKAKITSRKWRKAAGER